MVNNLNAPKANYRRLIFMDEPFMVQRPEEMLDINRFLINYAKESFKIALDQYKTNSPFHTFQPDFLLSEYSRKARKFGVNPDLRNNLNFEKEYRTTVEDALSFVADLCALYVKNHGDKYNSHIQLEADKILKRKSQYVYDNFYLGFGYFIKQVCHNENRDEMAILAWLDHILHEEAVIFSLIIRKLNYKIVASDIKTRIDPVEIDMACTYLFENYSSPRLIRISGSFQRDIYYVDPEAPEQRLDFLNQKLLLNLQEILPTLADY